MSATFNVVAERFRRAGQCDRAIALCEEGLAEYPEHLSARVTLGCALLDLGQYADAHRELQIVIKRAPDNLAAIRGLAELHSRGIEAQDADEMQAAEDARAAEDQASVAEPTTMFAEGSVLDVENVAPLPSLDDFDPVVEGAELSAMHFEIGGRDRRSGRVRRFGLGLDS